jgi:protein-export membrane protein SecD
MKGSLRWVIPIVLLTLFALWVSLPNTIITNVAESCYTASSGTPITRPEQGIHLDFDGDCTDEISLNVRQVLGLDLVGGLRVLLQAELPPGSFTIDDLRLAANNVERRVNALGVGEATVQVQGNNRILVELPGVSDTCQAISTIQKTALLEFVDFSGLQSQVNSLTGRRIVTTEQLLIDQQRAAANTASAEPAAGEDGSGAAAATTAQQNPCPDDGLAAPVDQQPIGNPLNNQPFTTVITGSGLQAASALLDPSGRWIIQFELTPQGGAIFGPYTAANIGQPMAIVLDGVVLSAPTIQARLDTGGTITGNFTEAEAKQLALQLRSGALPIPLRVESTATVGATLGQESVTQSIRAGIIGVITILLFLLINYRVPGLAACLALLVFIVLNMAIFKLIPITLTLPAIVGFLISIGTAVDGNILIFERMREELRAGKSLDAAIEEGFSRAWSSIRDSNFSTILICVVLFLFGQTPGASIVSGFALTLIIGLLINLFTAVVVTRTFLHLLVGVLRRPMSQRAWLAGV